MVLPLVSYIRRYVELSEQDLEAIRNAYEVQTLKKGDFFIHQGDHINEVAFVSEGVLRVFRNSKGKEVTLFLRDENSFVTSVTGYSGHRLSPYSVQTLEDSVLLVMSSEKRQELFDRSIAYQRFSLMMLERTVQDMEIRIDSQIADNAARRYLRLLEDHPSLIQRVPQYHLASYLGVTPESLSRLRKYL
ncbi:MAG: Crp/Fnr family transcriptional regulator [Siphonobacter sp.]